MYNPLKIFDDAFRKNGSAEDFKNHRLHPVLNWFEVAAFLSFIPGMLFFLAVNQIAVAFVLAGATVFSVREAEKGRLINSYVILLIFCLAPSIIFALSAFFEASENRIIPIIGSFFYLTLWVWGSFGVYKHKKYIGVMSTTGHDS